jgi:hypothetical protein
MSDFKVLKIIIEGEIPDRCIYCPFEREYTNSLHLDVSECTALKPNRIIEYEAHLYIRPSWYPLETETRFNDIEKFYKNDEHKWINIDD